MARICVFCASSLTIDPRYVELASRVGAALAARGHDLVSGGGSVSMMGAVAQAVRAGGRHTIGVIPQALVDREVADHDADELIVTPDMRSRKGRMDELADAFLTLPGGIGTLEELTEVWTAASLGLHAKPVVVLDPTGLYAPLHELIRRLTDEGFLHGNAASALVWTTGIDEALTAIEQGLGGPAVSPTITDQVESAP
ncbi:TIGR00730 family Rossman fold protein [Kineosporia sp. NBRC 101731]|uniref:LOG family protein n=1 Tax=Kineosporia sp. NBRC 101731 TaxID=3032199 RepID=UPI0024A5D412|nr:TIGR00730 family Rossman fold protein [Kineosporia sp. NBRC 101731]GLY28537.1 cytokinin riboside 5'-monophosphate phosphoribohydrolase [Kineosporia sp. NBRC 101731]